MDKTPHSSRRNSFSVRTAKRPSIHGSRRGSTIGRILVSQLQIHSCQCLNITLIRVQDNELQLPAADSAVLGEVFGSGTYAASFVTKTIQQPTLVAIRPLGVGPMGTSAGGGAPRWHLFRCANCQFDAFALSLSLSLNSLVTGPTSARDEPTSPTSPERQGSGSVTPFVAVLNPRLKHGEDVARLDDNCSKAFGILIKPSTSIPDTGPLSPLSPLTPEPTEPIRKTSSPKHSSTGSQASSGSRTSPSGSSRLITSSKNSPSQKIKTFYLQAAQASQQAKLAMEAKISAFSAQQAHENREFERRLRVELNHLTDLVHELSDDRQFLPMENFVEGYSPRSKTLLLEGVQENKQPQGILGEKSPHSAGVSPKTFSQLHGAPTSGGIEMIDSDGGDLIETVDEKVAYPSPTAAMARTVELSMDRLIKRATLSPRHVSPKHDDENHPQTLFTSPESLGGVERVGERVGLVGGGVGVGRPKLTGSTSFQLPALIESEKEPEEKNGNHIEERIRQTIETEARTTESAATDSGLFHFDEELETQSPRHFLKEDILPPPDESVDDEPENTSTTQGPSHLSSSLRRSIPIRTRAASSVTSDEMKKHRLSSSLPIQIPKAAFSLRTGGASVLLGGPSSLASRSRDLPAKGDPREPREQLGPQPQQRGRSSTTTTKTRSSEPGSVGSSGARDRSVSDLSAMSALKRFVIGRGSVPARERSESESEKPPPGVEDDEPDESQFVPPHTLTQEPFWSFAKVKYVASEQDSKRRHSIAGLVNEGGNVNTRPSRAGSDASFSLRPSLRNNLAGLPAPSLNNSGSTTGSSTASSKDLGIGVREKPPYSTSSGSLLLPRNSFQSSLSRALSSIATTANTSTASSRTSSPVPI